MISQKEVLEKTLAAAIAPQRVSLPGIHFYANNRVILRGVMMRAIINTCLLSFVALQCFCQSFNERDYTHYTVVNGLSDSYITGITQDELGYIWISTKNGLNRFDGKEVKRIYQIPGKESLITDDLIDVKAIGNTILTYSFKGAEWIDVEKNKYIKLRVSDGKSASVLQNIFYDAIITKNNTCFVSGYTGAYEFDSSGKLIFRYDNNKSDSTGNLNNFPKYGRSIVQLGGDLLLHFDSKYNMSIYNTRTRTFLPIEEYKNRLPGLYSLKGSMALKGRFDKTKLIFLDFVSWNLIIYDTEKDVLYKQPTLSRWGKTYFNWATHWVRINDSSAFIYGQHNGLYKIHVNPANFNLTFDTVPVMNSALYTTAFIDKDNRLWLGALNGLYKYNNKPINLSSIKHPTADKFEINHPVWFYCFFRSPKFLYAGTYSSRPFLVLDGDSYQIKKQVSFERFSKKSNQIWQIIQYDKDTLWFATQDGLIWYDERNSMFDKVSIPGIDSLIRHNTITLLFKDSKGIIWMQIGWGLGLIKYDPARKSIRRYIVTNKNNYLPLRTVNFVAEDKENNIWFAEKGLVRWNRQKDKFDTTISSYYGFNKDNTAITGLRSDEKGNLIFCNENNGILTYDPVSHQFSQITTAQGLQENAVYQAISLNKYMWAITHNYLTAINKKTSKAISYSYSDSLPAALFLTSYHDPIKKRLLVGYDNQFVWTNDSINKQEENLIPFYVDAVSIGNDTTFLFPGQSMKLKYHENDIRIHYSALNFNDPLFNRYAYRINHKEWIELGDENSIYFSNLSPGSYDVDIKYYSASNTDSEVIRKLTVVIAPPFWLQWWFFVIIAILVISVLAFFYRRKIASIRQKARIDKQIAEYEIKALHAQMNPHFIFNCLNSIREMILDNENRQASHYLSKFAHLIRLTLNNSSKPFINLQSTVDYLRRYLEMEQIRKSNFSYHIDIDESLHPEDLFLPPMLIQPFIENAIWHGASEPGTTTDISIRFMPQNNQLVCEVEDNGIGIQTSLKKKYEQEEIQSDHHSLGISNVKQRIHVLNEKYNLHSRVTIEDKSDLTGGTETGTLVILYLPMKNTEL
jgi:hypothetical protein